MTKYLCFFLILASTIANAGESLPGEEWSSPNGGYAVAILPGWQQISASKLPALPAGLPKTVTEVGFQRDGIKGAELRPPYLVFILVTKETAGLAGFPSEAKFNDIVKLITNGRTREVDNGVETGIASMTASDEVKNSAAYFYAAAASESVHVDTPRRRFWYTLDGDGLHQEGPMKSFTASVFLENGNVVNLSGFCRDADVAKDLPKFIEFYWSVRNIR